jgi:hypothetical protein
MEWDRPQNKMQVRLFRTADVAIQAMPFSAGYSEHLRS